MVLGTYLRTQKFQKGWAPLIHTKRKKTCIKTNKEENIYESSNTLEH